MMTKSKVTPEMIKQLGHERIHYAKVSQEQQRIVNELKNIEQSVKDLESKIRCSVIFNMNVSSKGQHTLVCPNGKVFYVNEVNTRSSYDFGHHYNVFESKLTKAGRTTRGKKIMDYTRSSMNDIRLWAGENNQ